jgi:hypothetical protein
VPPRYKRPNFLSAQDFLGSADRDQKFFQVDLIRDSPFSKRPFIAQGFFLMKKFVADGVINLKNADR